MKRAALVAALMILLALHTGSALGQAPIQTRVGGPAQTIAEVYDPSRGGAWQQYTMNARIIDRKSSPQVAAFVSDMWSNGAWNMVAVYHAAPARWNFQNLGFKITFMGVSGSLVLVTARESAWIYGTKMEPTNWRSNSLVNPIQWAGLNSNVAAAASAAQTVIYDHSLGKWVSTDSFNHLAPITAMTVEGNVVTIQYGRQLVTYPAGSGKFQQRSL